MGRINPAPRLAALTPLGISALAPAAPLAEWLGPVSAVRAAFWLLELLTPPEVLALQWPAAGRLPEMRPWPRPPGASPCQAPAS
jgi:hypothetical protein